MTPDCVGKKQIINLFGMILIDSKRHSLITIICFPQDFRAIWHYFSFDSFKTVVVL